MKFFFVELIVYSDICKRTFRENKLLSVHELLRDILNRTRETSFLYIGGPELGNKKEHESVTGVTGAI
jgi:hypothetical protein